MKYAERTTSQCLTQAQLERSLTGPEFQLDTRYGEHLNVIYVTMLLSGGMPLAYVTASIWFMASFWTEKFELLKLSRRPVAYGYDLAMMVANLLPYAVVSNKQLPMRPGLCSWKRKFSCTIILLAWSLTAMSYLYCTGLSLFLAYCC